ncbi:MAG: gliding motility protein GldM [Flavobacteriales bacterium]
MAGQKETSRQKMIGMMYLVLTALLALNISKDILDAFVIVNQSLAASSETTERKMNSLYTDFELAQTIDPEKVQAYWDKSQEARNKARHIITFIDSVKTELVSKTEKIDFEVADTLSIGLIKKKDDYDTATNILIGEKEDGDGGLASILKHKLADYQLTMRELLNPQEQKYFNDRIDLSDRNLADKTSNWETNNFYHTPLVASLVILSKLQMDVADVEYDVVNSLYRSFNKKDFFFDTIAATVLPQSNYVLLGEDYTSDIIVAAYSTTRSPKIRVGKLNEEATELTSQEDTVKTANGKGLFRRRTTAEGIFNYEGMVDLVDSEGKTQSYPFKSEYIVAKPSLVVSPTKMNVLYRGIENPVDISVPGVPSENLIVSISGGHQLTKKANGEYVAKMRAQPGNEASVSVSAKMADGTTRPMGKMKFRVKRLPRPFAYWGFVDPARRMTLNSMKATEGLVARYDESFVFDLTCRVKSFRVIVFDKRGEVVGRAINYGARFTDETSQLLSKVKKKYRVHFENVKAVGDDGVQHDLGSIVEEIF